MGPEALFGVGAPGSEGGGPQDLAAEGDGLVPEGAVAGEREPYARSQQFLGEPPGEGGVPRDGDGVRGVPLTNVSPAAIGPAVAFTV
ncbi:hypothetical protein GCM10027162_41830 [Streptomyces incanus]